MSLDEHRIYFSSDYCTLDKSTGSFTVNLPFLLDVSGKWKSTIRDIFIKTDSFSSSCIYILADFCDTSLIKEKEQLPILKKLYLEPNQKYYTFTHPLYVPVKQTVLSSFNLLLLNSEFKSIQLGEEFLIECTIYFYKHGR